MKGFKWNATAHNNGSLILTPPFLKHGDLSVKNLLFDNSL